MVDVLLAIGYVCLSICCWIQDRINKRQQLEIRELKRLVQKNFPEEPRCKICKAKEKCPAYETGVIYPCPYFNEEDSYGQQE